MKTENPWISFWKQFARLLDGGIPILTTLETLREELDTPAIRKTCEVLREQIKKGHSIYNTMERLPDYFAPSVVKMIQAGELSGTLSKAMLSVAAGIEDGSFPSSANDAADDVVAMPADTDESQILQIVGQILKRAVEQKASDIHIESSAEGLRLRYRQDGVLRPVEAPPKSLAAAIMSRFKIMANAIPNEKRLPQDGRIQINVQGKHIDLRASFFPTVKGESLVLRVMCKGGELATLEQVFDGDSLKQVQSWLTEQRGLILVNGPTGSGKTTTLYALLAACDAERNKIVTVEDPVEYPHLDGVCQQQARYGQGLTMAVALRSILRQDPDVVMASEIRDLETVQILVQGALTGHLVMASLHSDNSLNAVRRLIDIGVEPFLVHGTPVRIISQRLLRRLCKDCKQEIAPEPWMRDYFPPEAMPERLYHSTGCAACHGTGYRGRSAVHEVWQPSYEVVARVSKGESIAGVLAAAKADGLVTLRANGLAKALAGETTLKEVLRVTPSDAV